MDEFKANEATDQSLTPPQWIGTRSIPLVHQTNEQCTEILCELADTSSDPALPPFLLQNRELWRHLHTEARRRAAAFPFVIIDIRFKDAPWWRQMSQNPSTHPPDATTSNGIPSKLSENLILETLLFARQAARENLNVAKMLFGMTEPVAAHIASLTVQQVRAIVPGNTHHLRVRWDDNPQFWRELLIASRDADEETLIALRHHAKRLFCGEMIRPWPP